MSFPILETRLPDSRTPTTHVSYHFTKHLEGEGMSIPVGSVGSYRQLYINGKWVDSSNGKRLAVTNPATEESIAEVAMGTREDCSRAIEAASKALPSWSKMTSWDRAKILKKTAELIRERANEFAKALTMEQGKPVAEAKGEVMQTADTFEWFAEEGKRSYGQIIPNSVPGKRHMVIKHPVGVVGSIGPWNFPMTLQARKIAPALAAGCTIVAKPASQTPLSLVNVFDCLIDAGLPEGVANMIIAPARDVGNEFLENRAIRKISFTGSTAVGKELMRGAAGQVKRLSLELGGHAPFLVFPDADVEAVAKAAVVGKFRNNGQVCISPSRFFVHKDIEKKFVEIAVEAANKLKLGNGLETGIDIGPMFEEGAMKNTIDLIQDAQSKGANILTGGGRATEFTKGYFFKPTVLTNLNDSCKVLVEEPFAPVMPIMSFSTTEEALALANNTVFGLAAYVFTNDLSLMWKVAEGLEAGIIGMNDPVPATPQCPFGGMKESGLGRELAHEGLEAYLETKYISIRLKD